MKIFLFLSLMTVGSLPEVYTFQTKFINFTVRPESSIYDVIQLYMLIRPNVSIEKIETYVFKNGIINSMIRVNDSQSNQQPLVVRTYGLKSSNKTESLNSTENRRLELAVQEKASELNLTAKVIARFRNGIVLNFIDGNVLTAEAFDEEVAKDLAIKLAGFHMIKLEDLAMKEPEIYKTIKSKEGVERIAKENELYDKLMKKKEFDEYRAHLPMYSELQKEMEFIFDLILKYNATGQVRFCHNDLGMGNIMIERKTKRTYLIDFEMSNTNYNYLDIGKLFLRLTGSFGRKYRSENLPSEQTMKVFLKSYFKESHKLTGIQMKDEELEEFVEKERIKVLVNMLLTRLDSVQAVFYFTLYKPGALQSFDREELKNFTLAIYDDYIANKDKHIALLTNQHKNSSSELLTNFSGIFLIIISHFLFKKYQLDF